MSPLYLLIPILIPTICALAGLRLKFRSPHTLHVYIEGVAIVTTIVVWFCPLHALPSPLQRITGRDAHRA